MFSPKLTRFPVVSIPDLRQDTTSNAAHLLFPVSCQPSDSVGFPLWGQRPLSSTHLPNINCENRAQLTRLKNSQGKFRFAFCRMFLGQEDYLLLILLLLLFVVFSVVGPLFSSAYVGIRDWVPHQKEPGCLIFLKTQISKSLETLLPDVFPPTCCH